MELLSREEIRSKLQSAIPDFIWELDAMFNAEGHEICLVGGWVRNFILGLDTADYDMSTDATPDEIVEIVSEWADDLWTVGEKFGTIALRKDDHLIEITTYRTEVYSEDSRKPEVAFGKTISADLIRRDFTVNAMAIMFVDENRCFLYDPHNGYDDLKNHVLRTPYHSSQIIREDPLRILRAARFISAFNLIADRELVQAITYHRGKLDIVSSERISAELEKLLVMENPVSGMLMLHNTSVLQCLIPGADVTALQTLIFNELVNGDDQNKDYSDLKLCIRLAALMHNISPDIIRRQLRAMRFPNSVIRNVAKMVELHLRFVYTDADARRLILDSGDLLIGVQRLMMIDSGRDYGSPADIITRMYYSEKLGPELDGKEIMFLLGEDSGPKIGAAMKHLRELQIKNGPMRSKLRAGAEVLRWNDSLQ